MDDKLQVLLDTLMSRAGAHPASSDLGVINNEIIRLEEWGGFAIPSGYRRWLETFESATIDTVSIFGITGAGSVFHQQSGYFDRGWLNIANDGCGNYYALVLNREFGLAEPVIFVDAYVELDEVFIVASDFHRFVEGVLVKESGAFHWPFDQAETMKMDSDLQAAINIRLPWAE